MLLFTRFKCKWALISKFYSQVEQRIKRQVSTKVKASQSLPWAEIVFSLNESIGKFSVGIKSIALAMCPNAVAR